MHHARISFVTLALVGWLGAACSVDASAPGPSESPSPSSSSTAAPPATPGEDASATPGDASAPDAAKPLPGAPLFEVSVNGVPMKVKAVSSKVTNLYKDQGTSYYEVTAVLEQQPAIVDGLRADPSITIRVGKEDSGTDACKEVRGPAVGAVQPVTQIRDVQIKYQRFTGASTVYASPSTVRAGACTMTLEAPSTDGHAWGEARGSVQSGTDEPKLDFSVRFFQPIDWK